MENENKPFGDNPLEADITPQGNTGEVGGSNVEGKDQPSPEDFARKKIEEATGRRFKDLDGALKTVKNTYAENSRLSQKLVEDPTQSPFATRDDVEEIKFSAKYSDAQDYLDKVRRISKATGESFIEAFKSFGLEEVYLIKKTQKDEEASSLKAIPSGGNKLPPSTTEIERSREDFLSGREKPEKSAYVKARIAHLIPEEWK